MRSRRPMRIGALIALAAVLWWLALDRRVLPDEPQATPSPERAAPRQAVAAPPAQAPEEPAQQAAPEPSKSVAAPAPPAPEPSQPPAAGPIPPDTRGFVAALEEVYESSPRASNAGKSEAELVRLFRSEGGSAELLRSVLCREHVCRLELRWTPASAGLYERALEELTAGNAKNLATRAEQPDASGGVSVEVFWRRAAWESAR